MSAQKVTEPAAPTLWEKTAAQMHSIERYVDVFDIPLMRTALARELEQRFGPWREALKQAESFSKECASADETLQTALQITIQGISAILDKTGAR